MEYLTQWEFWQSVGLTVAARLSVVAVALWAVKMVTEQIDRGAVLVGRPGKITLTAGPEQSDAAVSRGKRIKPETPAWARQRGSPPVDAMRKQMASYLASETAFPAGTPRREKVR